MPSYTTSDIRNIALVGHGASGKTTLTEALLVAGGVLGAPGSIEEGTTVSDHTEEEQHHGHSLFNTVVSIDHNGKHINLIDTPGAGDFAAQAMTALPAVETACVVVSAQNGIEPFTRRIMEKAKERKLCRMIVINKIDADNVDLPTLIEQIRETFGSECLPINLPSHGNTQIVDVFGAEHGEVDFSSVEEAHTAIIDQVVEVDEELALKYLEGEEVSPEELHDAFETALREGHLVPICFTSAHNHASPGKTVGIKELLDVFTKLGPSPLEGNPRVFLEGDKEVLPEPVEDKHFIGHVFKVSIDRFGKLGAFRVHQGKVTKDTPVLINDGKKPIRVSHLYKLHGSEHKEVDAGIPGDICALLKVDELHFDAVLHDSAEEAGLHLKPLDLPKPMFGLAITAKSRNDETKIGDALAKIAEEDPCVKIVRDAVTHETVIYGMGDMHLRVILETLSHKYNVEVDTKPPKIAYRETIQSKAEGHHRHKKQSGGAGQFGEVYLRIEPVTDEEGFEFVNDIFGGAIPNQFIPAIEKGVRTVMDEGCIAGYPMQNIRVSVYDGKHHPVDSKEVAFVTAAKRAFADAVSKAKPTLLEPVVTVEVTIPNDKVGDITGDLSGKRGRIQGTDIMPGDIAVVKANVPLSEMMNYQSQLKSVTGGQGSFTMEFSHYEPVPGNVQQQIVAEYKPREEED